MQKQKNVLIIERDLETCKVLKYGLVAAGFHAYYCMTSREGIIHLLKGHYNIVILEYEMSSISGWDLLHIIRSKEMLPILIIACSDSLQDKVEAFRLGADDYIVKPFILEEVIARV